MLLCRAAQFAEPKQIFERKGKVGHDEPKSRKQLTWVPLEFSENPAAFAP